MERVDYQKLVIQDLINLHRADELNLNPWYQRRSVWTRPQRAYLINTVFEHKPIPTIYIRHYLDLVSEKSIKEVVDGQQRIRALLAFCEGEFTTRHPQHKSRVKYDDLTNSEREAFLMHSLSVGYLLGADDADVIEIFGRLNSVAKTLNEQERRNARFSGEFKQFCLQQAASRVQMWRDLRIFSANDIARMNEVQFVSDLALNFLNGLTDYSAARLNDLYKKHDDQFTAREQLEKRFDRVFGLIAALPTETIVDTIFSRQPLFFSLCIVLDSSRVRSNKQALSTLADGLHRIDVKFNSDTPAIERSKPEAEFHNACTASTQRIKSRKVRDQYLKKNLNLG